MGCLDNTKSTCPSPFCLFAKINLSQTNAVWWRVFGLWELHLLTANGSNNSSGCIFQQVFCVQNLRTPVRQWLWETCEYSLIPFQINFSRCPLSMQPLDSWRVIIALKVVVVIALPKSEEWKGGTWGYRSTLLSQSSGLPCHVLSPGVTVKEIV